VGDVRIVVFEGLGETVRRNQLAGERDVDFEGGYHSLSSRLYSKGSVYGDGHLYSLDDYLVSLASV
jgi:hypothetical protein